MFAPVKFTISAPGKVILFGEHSVVYGKPALAASINKRTSLTFETTSSKNAEMKFPNLNWEIKLPINEINDSNRTSSISANDDIDTETLVGLAANDVANLKNSKNFSVNQNTSLRCVFFLLRGLFSAEKISTGFKIDLSSELNMGAGTGSSASFSVCLSAAFYHFRRVFRAGEKGDSKNLRHFSPQDKEVINKWAFACEQIIHGRASGLDNYVCTYGSVVQVRSDNANKSRTFLALNEAPTLRILLVNTGVSRSTSTLVKKVADLRHNNQTVVDLVLNAMEEIVNDVSVLLQRLNTHREPVATVENRETFVRLEELVWLNQGLLSSLGVSHESLDNIVNLTRKFNLQSKLTGAGGGGYAITFIPPYVSEENVRSCIEMLQENGYQVDDIVVGDKGVDLEIH